MPLHAKWNLASRTASPPWPDSTSRHAAYGCWTAQRSQRAERPQARTAGHASKQQHSVHANADVNGNGMNITVLGASGRIGAKLVNLLRQEGHAVVAASLTSGLNTSTGAGLDAALAGAQVVVDVTNAPSCEDKAVLDFLRRQAARSSLRT